MVSELRRLGLAERLTTAPQRAATSPALRVHRLTRAVVRDLHGDPAAAVPTVLALLDAAHPDPESPPDWPRWAALLPHILDDRLGTQAATLAPEAYAQIRNGVGRYQSAVGLYPGARDSFTVAREIQERVLGEEHPDTLTSMNNLAWTLQAQGDLAGAQELHERVLAVRRRVLGEEHPATTVSAWNLFVTLRSLEDNEAAAVVARTHLWWLLDADETTLTADQRTVRANILPLRESLTQLEDKRRRK